MESQLKDGIYEKTWIMKSWKMWKCKIVENYKQFMKIYKNRKIIKLKNVKN